MQVEIVKEMFTKPGNFSIPKFISIDINRFAKFILYLFFTFKFEFKTMSSIF